MTQARFYTTHGVPVPELAAAAADFFRRDSFDAGFQTDYAGRTVLKIGKENTGRFILGLNFALTVVFTPQPDNRVLVELGGESWTDKIVGGALGAFFIFPLLFTAAYGAWKQSELDDQFWGFLDGHIQQRTGQWPNPIPAVPYLNAPDSQTNGWQMGNLGEWNYAPPPPPPPAGTPMPGFQAYQNYNYGFVAPTQPQQGYPPQPTWAPAPMAGNLSQRISWFSSDNMQPIFDQQVGRMASWQAVMADGVINYDELNQQQERVTTLQQRTEEMLETDARISLVEAMRELGKLEQLQRTALTKAYAKTS